MEFSASVIAASELIPGKFFFVTLTSGAPTPRQTRSTRYFSTDEDFLYNNFFRDFGPHSLGTLFKYCRKVEGFLRESEGGAGGLGEKRTVHYTFINDGRRRVNAAFLAGGYAIVCGGRKLDEVIRALCPKGSPTYITYRDASMGPDLFPLKLEDALIALAKAHSLGFFAFSSFNVDEYEFFEKVENGDFNWILPGKFLAFCGPHHESKVDNSEYPVHAPEAYFRYFKQHGVSTIIRLNKKLYEADRFRSAGFKHYDLIFNDGSTPSDAILRQFLEICEKEDGGIAVHCKAGLGRTGVLIGAYIVKHYRFTAAEAIAWLRICRPGSVIGWQQTWLEQKQSYLWLQGDLHPKTSRQINRTNNNKCFSKGIYYVDANASATDLSFPSSMKEVARIASKLRMTKIETGGGEGKGGTAAAKDEERTQGDDLNRLKVRRSAVAKRASVMHPPSTAAGKAKVWR